MKLTILLLLISVASFAQGVKTSYATERIEKEYWALAKDSITLLQAKGHVRMHLEAVDTATFIYQVIRTKKVWVLPNTTLIIQAETPTSKTSGAASGSFFVPVNGSTFTYLITTRGDKSKVTFTYALATDGPALVLTWRVGSLTAAATSITLPNTGGWGTVKTSSTFTVPVIRTGQTIYITSNRGFNLDFLTLSK